MKNILVLIAFMVSFGSCKLKKMENKQIIFNITTSNDYCGGANPPDEMVAEMRKPKPFTGKIYIHTNSRRQDEEKTIQVVNGVCKTVGYTEGTYYMYVAEKMVPPTTMAVTRPDQMRRECEMNNNRKYIASFTIDKKNTAVNEHLHIVCNPCLEPMP